MSHTFTQLLYHVVFSTQYRQGLIDPELRADLYPFMAAVIRNQRCKLLGIGGMPDHVHLLVRMRPNLTVSDLLRSVKANSSRWVHERSQAPWHFAWQEGYGAFSVSESAAGDVLRYIQTQEEHHRRRSFEEEWVGLLIRHGIEFDPANPFGDFPATPRFR
ncbi:MAG TPA: IS200/IS605 family transposase [Thermoanaerobaculia bacterium]|nr:IS200/IS605 family transposase [Thermoanaerobaculia bacterium]